MIEGCSHIVIGVGDIHQSLKFYHEVLACEILEDFSDKGFAAVRTGQLRISLFGGNNRREIIPDNEAGMNMVFKVDNIEQTVSELKAKGINFTSEIMTAPGFMKWIDLTDPDGNIVQIGQYLRDPLS